MWEEVFPCFLRVCKEAFDEEAQKLLEAVRVSNPQLIIVRDYNDHSDEDGSWWRCPWFEEPDVLLNSKMPQSDKAWDS